MRDAAGHDPVRQRFIEALARRAAGHQGEVRRLLDEKIAALHAAAARQPPRAAAAPAVSPRAAPQRGPLAELVDHIARHAPPPSDGELKTLKEFRSAWSRLNTDQRLTRSLAQVPENAGPLNSHHLVHRSLMLMRELSPDYLERFMAHVDALLWLEQVNAAPRR